MLLALSACGSASDAGDGRVAATQASGAHGSATSDTRRLVPVEIVDTSGFGTPMVAFRLQVPRGWQTAGGVQWNDKAECYSHQARVTWAAVAPDNVSVYEMYPAFVWQVKGTELPVDPCPVEPFRSARELLEAVAMQARPNARVLDYSDWPEHAARAEQSARRHGQPPPAEVEQRFDAGRVLIGYEADGVDMREVLAVAVTFNRVKSNGNIVAGAGRVDAYRAPNGQLDMGLLDRIVGSIEENPEWAEPAVKRVQANVNHFYAEQLKQIQAWHARRMAEINAKGAADRAAIWSRATREVAAMRAQTYANTQATNDRIHARTIDGIYERNAYAGIHGGTVYSSIHEGSRVFQDNSRTSNVWNTDDPHAQPSNATELERIR
ncbi:hypothetical protein FQY83_16665 [Luteimonas marina]|uniref:Uncharacterized protein n=1 Tax=Luteimonas marina TaxID=488485 RepID=A0A5C5TV66_9GAMM|nr:hypothetical protein [Luteimonas marina]TWT17556.1 hypothetical protein FQY83_16665 [Luteimonas marina]